jgi:hypothetical protein
MTSPAVVIQTERDAALAAMTDDVFRIRDQPLRTCTNGTELSKNAATASGAAFR